jgi:hypothetical protein
MPVYDVTLESLPSGKSVVYEIGQANGLVTLTTPYTIFAIPENTSYTISLATTNNFIN